jgi:hypothetical protein
MLAWFQTSIIHCTVTGSSAYHWADQNRLHTAATECRVAPIHLHITDFILRQLQDIKQGIKEIKELLQDIKQQEEEVLQALVPMQRLILTIFNHQHLPPSSAGTEARQGLRDEVLDAYEAQRDGRNWCVATGMWWPDTVVREPEVTYVRATHIFQRKWPSSEWVSGTSQYTAHAKKQHVIDTALLRCRRTWTLGPQPTAHATWCP